MAIDPLHSPSTGAASPGAAQPDATERAQDSVRTPGTSGATPPVDPGDTVQLSSVSLALQGQAESPPSGTISPERLQAILARVMSGFYETPVARNAVVQGLARDLTPSDETEGQ